MYCKNCGEKMYEGQTLCLKCGSEVDKILYKTTDKKGNTKSIRGLDDNNRTLVIILAVFFGWLGVHNFYMGETKKGRLKLLTCLCGISSILALIDIVKIITDKYTCNPDSYF